MRTYWVFWTFVANFSDKVREVEADCIEGAIRASTLYDPDTQSSGGSKMKFHVFTTDGHIFSGTIDDLAPEDRLSKED